MAYSVNDSRSRNDPAPFAGLDPDRIVDAVESLGIACDGRVLALNSYENRVFRIGREDDVPIVAKFYRPGRWSDAAIAEEHAFAAELRAAELSVVAPLVLDARTLHRHAGFRFALFALEAGRAPELDDRDTLRHLGRFLGRLHAVGAQRSFAHRTRLSVDAHGRDAVRFLLAGPWLPAELATAFQSIADALLVAIDAAWRRAGDVRWLRTHGDFHPGNVLWREGTAHVVDLDDAMTSPAMQDLWMLLSGDADEQRGQLAALREGYETFRRLDLRELALIEALRGLRLLHYQAWIARRWSDPAFPAAFPWFGDRRHWETAIAQLQEQLARLQEPPLALFD